MTKYTKIIIGILLIVSFFACGEKDGPVLQFQLTPTAWANNPAVKYVAFEVRNVANTGGTILDTNNDGAADRFGFPEECVSSIQTGACGYSPTDTSFDLGGIPLNYKYQIYAYIKSSSGTLVYAGQSPEFLNVENTSVLTITVLEQ